MAKQAKELACAFCGRTRMQCRILFHEAPKKLCICSVCCEWFGKIVSNNPGQVIDVCRTKAPTPPTDGPTPSVRGPHRGF